MGTEISQLKNLGKFSEKQLRAVGINDLTTLKAVGSINAFLLMTKENFKPSLDFLYAMEAALRNIHWVELPEDVKTDLQMQLDAAKDIQKQIESSSGSTD